MLFRSDRVPGPSHAGPLREVTPAAHSRPSTVVGACRFPQDSPGRAEFPAAQQHGSPPSPGKFSDQNRSAGRPLQNAWFALFPRLGRSSNCRFNAPFPESGYRARHQADSVSWRDYSGWQKNVTDGYAGCSRTRSGLRGLSARITDNAFINTPKDSTENE